MATSTPWGASQYAKTITRGATFFSTAGHGGLRITKTLAEKHNLPKYMIDGVAIVDKYGYWFEEDCACCVALLWLHENGLHEIDLNVVEGTIRAYYPEVYEKHFPEDALTLN